MGSSSSKRGDEAGWSEARMRLVVVAMVVLLSVEPGESREEFEEWSDPGERKREGGEEGAEGFHRTEED